MPKITEVYAFIAEDAGPDDEGIVAEKFGDAWLPLVGADRERVDSLKPLAERIAKNTGRRIKLVKFTVREVIEVL